MNIRNWSERFSTDLKLKYAPSTVKNYSRAVFIFLNYFKNYREPKEIPTQEIKEYLLTYTTHNTRKHMHCAISRFYELTVGMPAKIKKIPYPRKVKSLPRVIDSSYLKNVIPKIKNLKHRALLMTTYNCGMRRNEVINLKITDIDSDRMIIHIRNGKGRKDRIVPLSMRLLEVLRDYVKMYRPLTYLFNGPTPGTRYTSSSCSSLVKQYIGKEYSMHTLRHSYATALLENGTDISIIQQLLGHSSIKTTLIYTHISTSVLQHVKTPMD